MIGEDGEPYCAACSKPFRSGRLVFYQDGAFFHLVCRTQQLEHKALERVDRARALRSHATRLIDETRRRRKVTRQSTSIGRGSCPVCGEHATLTDWRPSMDWVGVEGCSCGGFFLWAGLPPSRLADLTSETRQDLAHHVREFRAMGYQAWCTTTSGTASGPLVIRTERPDRSA